MTGARGAGAPSRASRARNSRATAAPNSSGGRSVRKRDGSIARQDGPPSPYPMRRRASDRTSRRFARVIPT